MSVKVEKITPPITLAEGPHWDASSETLFFIDYKGYTVHSYQPKGNKYYKANIANGEFSPTFIIPVEGQKNKFVISGKNNIYTINWDGKNPTITDPQFIASLEPKDSPTRLNDGKADPAGRLWTGTMGKEISGQPGEFELEKGGLYSLSDGKVTKHLEKVSLSNGLAWSLDKKKFFYIDSLKYRVNVFDYDITSGQISNQQVLFDFKEKNLPGIPDGMTVDAEGKLIVAVFGGAAILRIDPATGDLISKIQIPVPQVTSVAFGGNNFDELYVTTANIYATPESLKLYPDAGSVYRLTNLGFKGLPPTNVKL
ncbi:regucalcin-like [Lycorma delicatula]|uniref:regucalcin-like n=1 Tax=Lycorma delicatula TaxID=130591 RepID=UPI003F514034